MKRCNYKGKTKQEKRAITSHFFDNVERITDPRCQSYVVYSIKVMIFARQLMFFCQVQSMAEMNEAFNKDEVIKNVSLICHEDVENLSHEMR